jgi:hypothetical protein
MDPKEKFISNPIRIGNIELTSNDFEKHLDWKETQELMESLGDGWRLPTEKEFIYFTDIIHLEIGKFEIRNGARIGYRIDGKESSLNLRMGFYPDFGRSFWYNNVTKCPVRLVRDIQ